MQIRVITMRYNEGLQGFPEDVLKTATFGRQVLDMKQEFFTYGNVPHIALTLSLADAGGGKYDSSTSTEIAEAKERAAKFEALLTDATKPAYLALKDWRNRKTKETKQPSFNIARNAQLAEIIIRAPKTIAALREIKGCGEAFCKKYGEEVLSLIKDLKPTPIPEDVETKRSSRKGKDDDITQDPEVKAAMAKAAAEIKEAEAARQASNTQPSEDEEDEEPQTGVETQPEEIDEEHYDVPF